MLNIIWLTMVLNMLCMKCFFHKTEAICEPMAGVFLAPDPFMIYFSFLCFGTFGDVKLFCLFSCCHLVRGFLTEEILFLSGTFLENKGEIKKYW